MSRDLEALLLAEISKQSLQVALFAEAEFPSGTVYVWSGLGPISWNSHTWTGLGGVLGVSSIAEGTEVRADGVQVIVSGFDSSLLATALTEIRQGRPAKIWFGCIDSTGAVIVDPYLAFSGRIDACTIDDEINMESGDASSSITLSIENRLIDFQRSRLRRYTHQDQQNDYPGDLGFEFVEAIQDWNGQAGNAGGGVPSHVVAGGSSMGAAAARILGANNTFGRLPIEIPNVSDVYQRPK